MNSKEYQVLVDKHTKKDSRLVNALVTFVGGGLMGLFSQILLYSYTLIFNLPRNKAGIMVILTLIVISSVLTAIGVFDICVNKLKCALIVPITGFAHSMTSSALEYKNEGLIMGIGSNIFKLSGSVILYGVVAVYVFGLLRLLIMGG